MLLADSCFNITHESFEGDLDDIIKKAIEQDVGYYFCPSSKENEIKDILDLSSDYKNRIISCLETLNDNDIVLFCHEDMFLYEQPNYNLLKDFTMLISNNQCHSIKLIRAFENLDKCA